MEAIHYFEKLCLKTDHIHIKTVSPCGKKMPGTGREIGAGAGVCKQQAAGTQMSALAQLKKMLHELQPPFTWAALCQHPMPHRRPLSLAVSCPDNHSTAPCSQLANILLEQEQRIGPENGQKQLDYTGHCILSGDLKDVLQSTKDKHASLHGSTTVNNLPSFCCFLTQKWRL